MVQPNQPAVLIFLWRNVGPYHIARARAAAERLAPKGIRTMVIELCDSEETRDWRVAREQADVEIVTLVSGQNLSKRSPDASRQLLDELGTLQPRYLAVAGYDRPEMRTAMRWANRHAAACILMSETKWDDRTRSWWKRWLASRLVRQANTALVSGGPAGEYLVALGMPREMIFRHYGAVDNAFFIARATDARRRHASQRVLPYFLACGRLIEHRKNIKTLLRAYTEYRQEADGQPWNLVICGDGPDRAELQEFATDCCADGVRFVGFKHLDELAQLYANAGCFVHTATNEAWGLVVNEAMACGLPVLVSRRCGCAYDLVREGGNGFTFDPNMPRELAKLLRRLSGLAANELRQMGQQSERIVQDFGCDQFAAGLEQAMSAADGLYSNSDDGAGRQFGERGSKVQRLDSTMAEVGTFPTAAELAESRN